MNTITWPESDLQLPAVTLDIDDLAGIMAVLGYSETQAREAMLVAPGEDPLSIVPANARRYIIDQMAASEVFGWHRNCIPGELQSTLFTATQREQFWEGKAADERPSAEERSIDIAEAVRARVLRRAVLTQPSLRRYRLVTGEGTWHDVAAELGSATAKTQIDHILRVLDGDTALDADVTVQLLPPSAGSELTEIEHFSVLRFPAGSSKEDFVHFEARKPSTVENGQPAREPDLFGEQHVLPWLEQAERLCSAAMDPDDSSRRLRELRAEISVC